MQIKRRTAPESKMKNLVTDKKTHDGFVNVLAKLGLGTDNLSSYGHYSATNFISRNRQELDMAYRGSWLVGQVVDTVAEDMTKDGVSFFSEMQPDDVQKIQAAISDYGVWASICDTIKWARLYGGAIAVILTEGADYEKPLRVESIGENTFRGLLVLDRWMIQPSMGELITEMGKNIGMPKYYEVMAGLNSLPGMKIHHTRVLRFDGIRLPYYQKLFENLWGLSVVERMLDRLLAFDSATQGAAQLLYKSHLRIVGVKGFREALAAGGATEAAVIRQFEYIRRMQTNEGLTVLDGEDTFDIKTSGFGGIPELIEQFATQVSGAVQIPIVRLFGQSPSGFSTGETDLRNYYDQVHRLQENQLRPQLNKLFEVISMSVLGGKLPEDFEFKFNPLWTLSDSEKSTIAGTNVNTIGAAFTSGAITKPIALKELLQQSRVTGIFTNITDEDIEAAVNEPPEPSGDENENPLFNNEKPPEPKEESNIDLINQKAQELEKNVPTESELEKEKVTPETKENTETELLKSKAEGEEK